LDFDPVSERTFSFQLSGKERKDLSCQFGTSSSKLGSMRSQIVTAAPKQKSRRGIRTPQRLLESNLLLSTFYFLITPSRGSRVSAGRSPPSWRAPDRPDRR